MYGLFTIDHEGKAEILEQKDTIEEIRAARKAYAECYRISCTLANTWIMEQFANDFVTASQQSPPESMVQIICWRQL
jgi:hypothetical protein